ncbi:MAG: alpha/beta hydrolase [Alphaproteobacteria bacterium]|nr:alpha/beta hydrolase [Alphaproteobacteria bacterium]
MASAEAAFEPRFLETRDGVRLRAGLWNAAEGIPFRGVCLVLQGHSEFLEKYFEVFDELRGRGFAVAAFDWRGQGGSARALEDSRKAHIIDFAQYAEDLRAFMDQIVRHMDDRPPFALAHSMGGHILLRNLHDHPGIIRAAAFSAPMLRVFTNPFPENLAIRIARWMVRFGRGNDYVFGAGKRDPIALPFAQNIVTSDPVRYARTIAHLEADPSLCLAGPTWHWLSAAFASMAITAEPGYAEAITAPVMIATAGHDRVVRTEATIAFAQRMPHCFHGMVEGAEHEILMEQDHLRALFWQAFDDFIARALPGT